jgi:hypothetical protein
MTTIIYDPEAGEIASESQDTGSNTKTACKKLYRIGDYIIGTAGGSYSGLMFLQWFKEWDGEPDYLDRDDQPHLVNLGEDEDFECIVVRPGRSCYTVNRLFTPYEMLPNTPIALGSGAAAALAALYAGVDVREAVKIACKIDPYSSGRIQYMKVKSDSRK